jgi:hypothetical protein
MPGRQDSVDNARDCIADGDYVFVDPNLPQVFEPDTSSAPGARVIVPIVSFLFPSGLSPKSSVPLPL